MKEQKLSGHILAIVTVWIWGTTFISTKILLREFTPVAILFLRFFIAFVAISLVCPRRLKWSGGKIEGLFALAGICGVTLYFLLENIALTYSTASNVGVIVCVAPFFTGIFAQGFLAKELLDKKFFCGFAAAMSGILLISYSGSVVLQLNPLGDLLAVLASIVWAAYSILVRKIGECGYGIMQTTKRIFGYGLLFVIPTMFFLPLDLEISKLRDPIMLMNISYLGLGASAVCFVTWNKAIKILGAIKTSTYMYLVPVITVVASVIILQENINEVSALGTLLALSGLGLSQMKPKTAMAGEERKDGFGADQRRKIAPTVVGRGWRALIERFWLFER